ncbi:MAG: MATE family efflux transporter [Ruminococcus sp.]|nr:MATE family efflux transporter [Ruminococcus sp.]
MTRDMTKGRPLGIILGFCLPMTMGNLFQQLYNMADSIIVGQYVGVKAFSAVGLVGSVYFLVIGTATGICSGFSIPIAQRFGAEDYKGMRKTLYNAVMLAAGLALFLTAVTAVFAKPLLRLMSTPDDLIGYAYRYILIIFLGIPVTIFFNLMAGVLRALGDSKTPLRYLLISSGANIVLDLTFIIAFHMGVAGAALATVLSQLFSGLLCLRYMINNLPVLGMEKDEMVIDRKLMTEILAIGMPMALQFSITAVGSIILQSSVNRLGSEQVAAMAAGQKIQNFIVQPMETLGVTMATFGGQNLGARRLDRIHQGMRQAFIVQIIYTCAIAAAVYFFGAQAARIFIRQDSENYALIVMNIRHFLRVTCLFYPILGLLFLFRNCLQGLGFSAVTLLAGAVELISRCVVAFGFVSRIGFDAACFASPAAWSSAGILLIFLYVIEIRKAEKKVLNLPLHAAL